MRKDLPYEFSVPAKWYSNVKEDKGPLLKASRPFSLLHPSSGKAVLLVHGYTGYPGEMVRPAEDLYSIGFDVFVPRLPGHGTNGRDFLKTGKDEWLEVPINAVEDLLSRYAEVCLVGHSMGSTICSILLSENRRIKRAVLACPAYSIPGLDEKTVRSLEIIKSFKKKLNKDWVNDSAYNMHYEDAPNDDITLGKEYWSHIYPRQLLSLNALTEEASRSVLKIKTPTLIIEAGDDKVVDNSYTDLITKADNNIKRTVVENATHMIYYDKVEGTEDKAVALTLDFLNLEPESKE